MTDKKKLLVVLQNPYKRDRLKNGWNPAAWRRDFESSRTGRRLSIAIPPDWEVRFTNANPRLGEHASSKFDPDTQHLQKVIRRVKPDFVLACGIFAEKSCSDIWQGPMIAIPHPAHRLLTNELLRQAHQMICVWLTFHSVMSDLGLSPRSPRIGLRQKKGFVTCEKLDRHLADSCV